MKSESISIVLILIFFTQSYSAGAAAQICNSPENEIGRCIVISQCPSFGNFIASENNSMNFTEYVKTARRNCRSETLNSEILVCCKDAYTEPKRMRIITPTSWLASHPNNTPQCVDPVGKNGDCKELKDCEILLDLLDSNQENPDFVDYLRKSTEICRSGPPVVCCPNLNEVLDNTNRIQLQSILPNIEDGCGISNRSEQRIVGGIVSQIGAWPWLALLLYDDTFSKPSFKCGGSLITRKHVLTAAHCIRWDLTSVRLGEHEISIENEARHIDVEISEMIQHAQFSSSTGRNDIGLLKLEREVFTTEFIRPICLLTTLTNLSKSYVGEKSFIAGWGKTLEGGERSTILLEARIPILENSLCRDVYAREYQRIGRKFNAQDFDEAVVCAGDLSGIQDSCDGDSGGPLMIAEVFQGKKYYHAAGLVSHGIGCAHFGVPSIYTNVLHYLEWIKEKLSQM